MKNGDTLYHLRYSSCFMLRYAEITGNGFEPVWTTLVNEAGVYDKQKIDFYQKEFGGFIEDSGFVFYDGGAITKKAYEEVENGKEN